MPTAQRDGDPGDVIAEPKLRALYDRFMTAIRRIHPGIVVRPARMESRIVYRDAVVCRVVPYRELFHVQVGGTPGWETRVRDADDCAETLHRVLNRWLDLYSRPSGTKGRNVADP